MSLASKIYSIKCKLYTFLVIPHILAFVLTGRGKSFKYDLLCMFGKCDIKTFISILYGKKYMRNLFYYRMGYTFFEIFSFLCPPDKTLHIIGCGKIGKRCFLQHSQNTFLNAESIGDDFYCLHNVTIGNDKIKGRPTIGNNVSIYTGAVVVGHITIGNNVTIAANAVVRNNIPNNVLVAGVPAKIVKYIK